MRSSATRGTGQLRLYGLILASAKVIVGRARAFGRYHGSAQRIFGRALHSKGRTLVRLLEPLQNQSADALRRLLRGLASEGESAVGIVFLKSSAQLKTAGGNLAQAAPLSRRNFKYLRNSLLRRAIPFPAHGARVLIFYFVPSLFELAHGHVNA